MIDDTKNELGISTFHSVYISTMLLILLSVRFGALHSTLFILVPSMTPFAPRE